MVLVDRDGWEAERVQVGYRSAWQRNRDGKVRAVDLYSRDYDKENELIRAGMVYLLSGALGLHIVNEFPQSGGTRVGQMLGRALGVPFPRNRFPAFRSSIMHGHYLGAWGMKNVVVVWRDGRDVMVSWYHQQLIPHELNRAQVARSRRELPDKRPDRSSSHLQRFGEPAGHGAGHLDPATLAAQRSSQVHDVALRAADLEGVDG
jgi:hypothetical protein